MGSAGGGVFHVGDGRCWGEGYSRWVNAILLCEPLLQFSPSGASCSYHYINITILSFCDIVLAGQLSKNKPKFAPGNTLPATPVGITYQLSAAVLVNYLSQSKH